MTNTAIDPIEFLVFSLGSEQFAISLLLIKEITVHADLAKETTVLPQMPDYFRGMIHLRGQMVCVIDLRLKMGLPKASKTRDIEVLVLDLAPYSVGVEVDWVDRVLRVNLTDIQPHSGGNGSITGVVQMNGKSIYLVDIKSLLNLDEIKASVSVSVNSGEADSAA